MRIGALVLFIFCVKAAAAGDPACAKNPTTLRKGPGSQFPVSWKVSRFMPFLKGEKKNGWVNVQDLEGETHWAQARDLTTSMQCLVVKSPVATLRKEPSTSAATADLRNVDKYTPFKRTEAQGEWYHVEDETGRSAWLHESTIWKPTKFSNVDF